MTGYELVGNLNTLDIIDFLTKMNAKHYLDLNALKAVVKINY